MLFRKGRSHDTTVNDFNSLSLQDRWLVTTLALMGFAEKYHYYLSIGHDDWDRLPFDSRANDNVANETSKQVYLPNEGHFIGTSKSRSVYNNKFTSQVRHQVHFKSKTSGYTYDLNKPIVARIYVKNRTHDFNNDEMRDKAMDKSNNDDSRQRELFANSLANNVAGKDETSPNHTIVKNTILNQIDTNPVLSDEYKHFLSSQKADEELADKASSAAASEKKASDSAIIFRASTSSASATLESVVNNNPNNINPQSASSSVENSFDLFSNENSEQKDVSSIVPDTPLSNNDKIAGDSAESSASAKKEVATYFDDAKNKHEQVDSIHDFANSVSDYISGSVKRFDEFASQAHSNMDQTDDLMNQIDDNGEKISEKFDQLSSIHQNNVNDLNKNVQSIAEEHASMAEQIDSNKAKLSSNVEQINNDIDGLNNAYNDANQFFSAANLSFNNSDENSTKIYTSYVNSAASVAALKNADVNDALNSFNSLLAVNSSFADKTSNNAVTLSSDVNLDNSILKSLEAPASVSHESTNYDFGNNLTNEQDFQSTNQFLQNDNDIFHQQAAFQTSNESTNQHSFDNASLNNTSDFGMNFAQQGQFQSNFQESMEQKHSNTNDNTNNISPVADSAVQSKIDTIGSNYNKATQMVNKMDVATKQLVNDNQHLQDLFSLLKGEFDQTKEQASKSNTTSMIAMSISKMDALMANASQIINRVKQVNQNTSNDYQSSVKSLNKIKQYQDQLNSIVKIAQTFDPLTAVSLGSMADSTLNRTNDYYQQIKKVNDDLVGASKSIQSEIDKMNSYYQLASKNSRLMEPINQMSSAAASVREQSSIVDSLFSSASANFSGLDSYKDQANSLMNKMDKARVYVNQRRSAIDEYASMMPKNKSLAQLSDRVSRAVQQVDSAQNDVQQSANDIDQTYSMANTPMNNLSNVRSQIQIAGMNTNYYASQAVINFNTGDLVSVDNSIKQMDSYEQALSSMCSVASNAANDVSGVLGQVNPGDSFNRIESIVMNVTQQADEEFRQANEVYNGLSKGISRANTIATNVSRLFDDSTKKTGSTDRVINNVNTNIQHVKSILNAIGTSNDITQLYSQQIINQLNNSNGLQSKQAAELSNKADAAKQSMMDASPIEMQIQQIETQLSQRRDLMNSNYSLISNQADTANQYIQRAFEEFREGNLDIANSYLDQAENVIQAAKQTLSNYQSDLDWVQSMIVHTNELIQKAERINSVVSNAADTTQQLASQLRMTK